MPFPEPPSKIVQFRDGKAAPYDVERQFDEHARAFRALVNFLRGIIRDDGMLRNEKIGPEQLTPDIGDLITKKASDALESLLISIQQRVRQASAGVTEMTDLLERIREREHHISMVASGMQGVLEETRAKLVELKQLAEAQPRDILPPWMLDPGLPGILGPPFASTPSGIPGFYGADPFAATGVASDYAQVSMEWAEHMPDTIPPNILAINAITGDHWSARWWANRAGSFFGGATAWMYLGPFPSTNAPSQTPTGEPLQQGMLYYATDLGQGMVWNGSAWQPLGKPTPAVTSALFYKATANQTVFQMTTADLFGNTFTLQIGQGVAVYMNGVRLAPDNGSGTLGDYTVNISTSTVTLGAGVPANTIVGIDALTLPIQLAPSVAKIHKLKPLTPAFDGTRTVFTLQSADGTTVNVTASEQVIYSLDGVSQEPVTAFTAAGATLTFASAPSADAYGFGIWASPT